MQYPILEIPKAKRAGGLSEVKSAYLASASLLVQLLVSPKRKKPNLNETVLHNLSLSLPLSLSLSLSLTHKT
jgi:hypothetical protein